MPARSRFAELAALAALATTAPAFGQEATDWQFHGFIGQRLTITDRNNFFGRTERRGSAEYTEIGASASWQPHPAWLASVQAISRRAGDSEDGNIGFDYAFVGWTPVDNENTRLNVKLGRTKIPYGFFNESRDTPGARSGIIPPQGIYFDGLRAFNQTSQGLNLEAVRTIGEGSLTFNLSNIKPSTSDKNAEWVIFGREMPGRLASEQSYLARLVYDHQGGKLRLGLTQGRGAIGYRPGAVDPFLTARTEFVHRIFSAQYNAERWTLTLESNRSQIDSFVAVAGGSITDVRDSTHWYLEGRYRFAPRWELLLRHDKAMDDRAATDDWTRTTTDHTIGIRYRPDGRWLLASELHAVDGVSWLPPVDNLQHGAFNPAGLARRWNLLMFQASYQF